MEGSNLPALIISSIVVGVNHGAAILFYVSLLFSLQSGTIFLAGRFLHGVLSPLIHQRKGGERMSDYEMIMIQLTILSLVVGLLLALIKKDK